MVTPHQQQRQCHKTQLSGVSGWADLAGNETGRKRRKQRHAIKILLGLSSKLGFLTSCRMLEIEALVWPTDKDAVAQTSTAHRSSLS